jgi:hypothetical protein
MRVLCQYPDTRLINSIAYHPQTGQSENFNHILITGLRFLVNRFYSDWKVCLPSVLYAYHNSAHSSTGLTHHPLFFGWGPTDLPFGDAALHLSSDRLKVDACIQARAHDLEKAQMSLDYARPAIMRAHQKGAISHTRYLSGWKSSKDFYPECTVGPL